jgi:lysophospholipase L1-like esterase
VTWGTAVASGTFPNSAQEQEVLFASTPGRYVRLQAITEVNGLENVSAAELTVLQAPILMPSVKLILPQSNYQQTSADLYVLAEASLTSGQGIRLTLDGGTANGGSQVDIYSGTFATTFTNISVSPHTVDAYVIDQNQQIVGGLLTHDQATEVGIGEYYVAMGDSITEGFADDIPSDDISQDGRTTGGGFEPILADSLANSLGHPAVVYDEGIGGDSSIDGIDQTQRVLQKYRDATHILIMYGTNDVEPTGQGLHPGDAGYAGSFKENMQRIINDVKSAGKIAVLAKLPPNYSAPNRDADMQAYNVVIDELVTENGIPITPPDFHSYFAAHPDQLVNGLHPNGLGYQAMAQLWLDALNP